MIGIRESSRINDVIVAIKLIVIGLFILFAVLLLCELGEGVHPDGNFIPPNAGSTGAFDFSGVVRGAAVVFFAFVGFDAVSTAAQQAKQSMRDMPIGIMGSLVISTVLYVTVGLVLTGILPYDKHQCARPDRGRPSGRRHHPAEAADQARHRAGSHLGHPRLAARPAPHLPRHGP